MRIRASAVNLESAYAKQGDFVTTLNAFKQTPGYWRGNDFKNWFAARKMQAWLIAVRDGQNAAAVSIQYLCQLLTKPSSDFRFDVSAIDCKRLSNFADNLVSGITSRQSRVAKAGVVGDALVGGG